MNQGVFGRNFCYSPEDCSDKDGPYKKGMLWKVHLSFLRNIPTLHLVMKPCIFLG